MKIYIIILYSITLKIFNNISINNNKCKFNNFYSLELKNNFELICIYNYNNIDPNFIFNLFQNKTKKFINNFKESNFEEINKIFNLLSQ